MAELGEGLSGYLDVQDATLRAPRLEAVSSIGIANTAPQHAFSVGSNLYIDTESSNVLTVDGNVVCEGVKVGLIEIVPSYDFAAVSNVGNVTQSTIQFSNATTGFVTTANIEVGTANLFVDTVNSRVGIGTTEPVSGLTVFRDIESANSFITERVLFKETWPNGHNSLIGDLGTWVVTNANLQSNPSSTTTPDGYTLVGINGDDSANGEFVSPAFDLSDYAIVDGTLQADNKRKTTTRVFLKCFFGTKQLDASGEVANVQFSPDNGSTWYTVATSQDRISNTDRFTMVSADLSPYILETSTNAKIRFYMPWSAQSGDYMRIGRIWIHESDVPTNLGGMWLGAGGNIGIGKTDPGSALDIYKEDTTAAGETVISSITGVFSGSDATGGNITNRGLFIDLDSSATGGTATNTEEHRVWGIDVDIDVTGDSDDIKGGRFLVRSEMAANGIDQNTNIYGIDSQGQHNGTGPCTNIIGVNARSFKGSSSTGFTDTMIGVQAEYEINAGTCTDAYAVRSRFDRNGGAVTNSYLFYGEHLGSATTITNNYGLYVTDVDKHYLEGNVGIGTTNPSNSLHIYKNGSEATSGLFIEKANNGSGAASLFFGVADSSETNNVGIPKAGIMFQRTATNGRGDLKFCVDNVDNTDPVGVADAALIITSEGYIQPGQINTRAGSLKGNYFFQGIYDVWRPNGTSAGTTQSGVYERWIQVVRMGSLLTIFGGIPVLLTSTVMNLRFTWAELGLDEPKSITTLINQSDSTYGTWGNATANSTYLILPSSGHAGTGIVDYNNIRYVIDLSYIYQY
jgi:hypothetical protein